jgi:hypothetical protein
MGFGPDAGAPRLRRPGRAVADRRRAPTACRGRAGRVRGRPGPLAQSYPSALEDFACAAGDRSPGDGLVPPFVAGKLRSAAGVGSRQAEARPGAAEAAAARPDACSGPEAASDHPADDSADDSARPADRAADDSAGSAGRPADHAADNAAGSARHLRGASAPAAAGRPASGPRRVTAGADHAARPRLRRHQSCPHRAARPLGGRKAPYAAAAVTRYAACAQAGSNWLPAWASSSSRA